jgi:hypothetical protein
MNRIGALGLAAVAATCVLGTWALADEHEAAPKGPVGGKMSSERREHMKQRMEEMRARGAELEQLVKTMNESSGTAKVDAIAAVLNELVAQHQMMRHHRGEMRQGMRGHGMRKGSRAPESSEER